MFVQLVGSCRIVYIWHLWATEMSEVWRLERE